MRCSFCKYHARCTNSSISARCTAPLPQERASTYQSSSFEVLEEAPSDHAGFGDYGVQIGRSKRGVARLRPGRNQRWRNPTRWPSTSCRCRRWRATSSSQRQVWRPSKQEALRIYWFRGNRCSIFLEIVVGNRHEQDCGLGPNRVGCVAQVPDTPMIPGAKHEFLQSDGMIRSLVPEFHPLFSQTEIKTAE